MSGRSIVILPLSMLLFGSAVATHAAPPRVDRLRCEYLEDPLGIDTPRPQLSWVVRSGERAERQTAYQILVATSPELLQHNRGDLWDSGKVISDRSSQIEYAGKPLQSYMHCSWKVRVWNKDGQPSDWSKLAFWSMGLLDPAEWQARWLASANEP